MKKGKKEKMPNGKVESPCYVLHENILDQNIQLLKNALEKEWNHYAVGYSFKTNSLPWLVKKMKREGFYAEVVSEDEYNLAVQFGYQNIIYNGPVKGKNSFLHALQGENIINLDAKRELDWLQDCEIGKAKVGLRVNFDLESLVPGETSPGAEGSRFGFSLETGEFEDALRKLESLHIPLSGLHIHVSTKTRSVEIYRVLARKICEIKETYQLSLKYVDLGGGYFGGFFNKPQFPDYVKSIKEELEKVFDKEKTMLIMEPGTSLLSPPMEYITTVVDTKDTYANHIVITDGSRIDIDPRFMKKGYFQEIHYKNVKKELREIVEKQVIAGFTCMEDDRLFIERNTPKLEVGDQISYYKVGGYTMCLTPLFIRYFPKVYVEKNGNYELIREAWGPEEYCQKSYY